MKRLNINSDQVNFIDSWNLENDDLCKDVISFFASSTKSFELFIFMLFNYNKAFLIK